MGQIHKQGDRAEMIDSLKKTDQNFFYNINESWQSSDSLSVGSYREVLENSLFSICPRGNSSVDTFRLYESIEAGSIPIVVRDEYWKNLFGENHPLIECGSWDKALKDILKLNENDQFIEDYRIILNKWWNIQKLKIKNFAKNTIQYKEPSDQNEIKATKIFQNLKTKQKQLLHLKDKWKDFIDDEKIGKYRNLYEWIGYVSETIKPKPAPDEKFSIYNPGKKIAIISLYTPNISNYAVCSELNIKAYCQLQGYTFYVYRDSLDSTASPNWSKAQTILNHIDNHDAVLWLDSDTLIFNPFKKIEEILNKTTSTKKIIACKDVGLNGSMLNSGAVIFKNDFYSKNILNKWKNFNGDKSSLYASGGDQEILCDILKKSDPFGHNRKIFSMNEFNTEPRMVDKDTFIIHFMAFPHQLKVIFMNYFVS